MLVEAPNDNFAQAMCVWRMIKQWSTRKFDFYVNFWCLFRSVMSSEREQYCNRVFSCSFAWSTQGRWRKGSRRNVYCHHFRIHALRSVTERKYFCRSTPSVIKTHNIIEHRTCILAHSTKGSDLKVHTMSSNRFQQKVCIVTGRSSTFCCISNGQY